MQLIFQIAAGIVLAPVLGIATLFCVLFIYDKIWGLPYPL